MQIEERLSVIRGGMRVVAPDGRTFGHVRQVSGRSLLVKPYFGSRVLWVEGRLVTEIRGNDVILSEPGMSERGEFKDRQQPQ